MPNEEHSKIFSTDSEVESRPTLRDRIYFWIKQYGVISLGLVIASAAVLSYISLTWNVTDRLLRQSEAISSLNRDVGRLEGKLEIIQQGNQSTQSAQPIK